MRLLFFLPVLAGLASALPASTSQPNKVLENRAEKVTVTLPYATVIGKDDSSVESFNGIPYAEPPEGPLRLKPPKKLERDLGEVDATGRAPACPQMYLTTENENLFLDIVGDFLTLPILEPLNGQEDCLTMSVQRPSGTKEGDKLPVLFWIFGGGFELGATNAHDAAGLVKASAEMSQPFIFVSVNYRVGAFGFMPGREILEDGSANLGLLDQRMGLEWTADYIEAFGGDPEKVTIWGQSAGSISVLDQMVLHRGNNTYKDKKLFRGTIMNSGSIIPAHAVDSPKAQAVYDKVVQTAGCHEASNTLECLRELDYTKFLQAGNSVPGIVSYHSVALSYLPRPDGTVLPDTPDKLVTNGEYAAVPMIVGSQEDEGTMFSLFQPNLTTTDDVVEYLSDLFFHDMSTQEIEGLVETYPEDASEGSPFRTGILNELYPGFKRVAALLGDLVFTLTRRVFLEVAADANPDVPSWSYLFSRNYGTPVLGTFHGSELGAIFDGTSESMHAYYVNFVNNLDPNEGEAGLLEWPRWRDGRELMWFVKDGTEILDDDFRGASFEYIKEHVDTLRI